MAPTQLAAFKERFRAFLHDDRGVTSADEPCKDISADPRCSEDVVAHILQELREVCN